MIHSGDACWYTSLLLPEQTYDWYVNATDNKNSTDSAELTVTSDVGTGTAKITALLEEQGVTSGGGATLSISTFGETLKENGGLIIIGLIVAVIVIFAIRKKFK